ncbi:MAG TPA: hypothetical protein VLS53_03700 [Candidatus Dormibacteraeota bacterium]|nr:hypothetical protein [Candidatus Dormibacteraeota bacterium]
MSSEQLLVGLAAGAVVLALWAAVFATRADIASRRAIRAADARWEATTRPVPHLTFIGSPAAGRPIELEVENLGGTLTAGGVIVQAADDLYAGELTLPDKAPPRRIVLQPAMKAWQRASEPRCLLLLARDVSGKCWDCVDGNKPVKDPRKWLAAQLKELRLQGVVDFPALTSLPR